MRRTPRRNPPGEPRAGARRPARAAEGKRGARGANSGAGLGERQGTVVGDRPQGTSWAQGHGVQGRGLPHAFAVSWRQVSSGHPTLQVPRRAAKRPSDIFPAIKPVHLMTPWAAGPAAAGPRRGRLPAPAQAAVLSCALYSSQTRWQCPAPDGRSPRAHWRALELRPSGLRGRRPLLPPRGHTRNTGLDEEPVHLQHLLRTGGSEPGHPGKGGPRGEGRLPRCGGRSTGMLKARGGGRGRQRGSELGLAVTRLRDKGPRAEKGDTRPDRER